ncbi:MAG: ankyrin repeat domain-containing protein [Gemmatimonadota bacterium]
MSSRIRKSGRGVIARGLTLTMSVAAAMLLSAGGPPNDAPVADAVMKGDSTRVRLLIKQGLDVNAAQADGMTALHWAASRGDAATTRMLVSAGARLDAMTRNGNYTPLHLAARSGRADATKSLLDAGANVNAITTTGGATALHFASSNGDAATITALLDKGAPVDAREGAWSQTPLMWAAAANRVAAVEALIKRGADIEATSKVEDIGARERADRVALTARARRVAALKSAETPAGPSGAGGAPGAAAGGAPAGTAPAGTAPAGAAPAPAAGAPAPGAAAAARPARDSAARPAPASQNAAPRTAAAAAPAGSNAAAPAAPGATAAGAAAAGGAAAPRDSARPNTGFNSRGPSYGELIGNKGGLTPLLFAVREGHTATVNALLLAGAKVNHVSAGDHTSPLLMASMNGYFDMAKMLLEKGADPKLASDANATPLYTVINVQWAAKSLYPQPTAQQQQQTTHLELMEALLKAGADPNVRLSKHLWYMSYNFDLLGVNTTGATPFWRAAYGTDVDAMKLLLKYKADPSIPTVKPSGRLPGDDAPAEDESGGKDPSGLPPVPAGGPGVFAIHAASGVGYGEGYAANSHRHAPDGWIPSMKFLIEELKVDVNSRDFNGFTPLHHAAARGDNDAIKYLMSKGADITAISRRGQTVADMANGPVQRIPPFLETVELLVKLGSKNSNKCKSC